MLDIFCDFNKNEIPGKFYFFIYKNWENTFSLSGKKYGLTSFFFYVLIPAPRLNFSLGTGFFFSWVID
jgi:hypothetical protein